MPMNRAEVFAVIDKERVYQDTVWPRDAETAQMYTYLAPHLVLLEEYILKARTAWVTNGPEAPALKQIAKLAAIAIRALEETAGAKEATEELR